MSAAPQTIDDLLNDGSGLLRRYIPPEHQTGWREARAKFSAPVARDPDLTKPISVESARKIIAEVIADLGDARAADGAERLVFELERLLAQRKSIFDRFLSDTPPLEIAQRNHRAAEVALEKATGAQVRGSLDREEALRLAGDIEHARQVLRIREREKDLAQSIAGYQNGKMGDAFAWMKPNSPRAIAKKNVQRIATEALGGNVSDAAVEAPADELTKMWEALWSYRALKSYKPNAESLPVEALRAVFNARRDPVAAQRAGMRSLVGAARGARL